MLLAREQFEGWLAGARRRGAILLAFSALFVAPAEAVTLTDDEPDNDSINTAAIDMVVTGGVGTHAGELELVPGDIDYLGISGLVAGDIVTITTTPLEDAAFETPDTIIGLFDDVGSEECESDDAFNNELDPFPTGYGGLCRFVISSAGDYYVGVTGYTSNPFDGQHTVTGTYQLSVTVIPEPAALLQLVAGATGLAALGWRRRRKPAAGASLESGTGSSLELDWRTIARPGSATSRLARGSPYPGATRTGEALDG